MTMYPITDLYKKLKGKDTIHILGCAENLNYDLKRVKIEESDLTIAANSAFLLRKVDYHFFACRRFIENYQEHFQKKTKLIHHHNITFDHDIEYYFRPVWRIDAQPCVCLKAGRSVLIPSLHFAFLCKPKKIYLLGFDLNTNDHWDGKNYNSLSNGCFPAWQHVLKETDELINEFDIPVYCINERSLFVKKEVIPCLPSSLLV